MVLGNGPGNGFDAPAPQIATQCRIAAAGGSQEEGYRKPQCADDNRDAPNGSKEMGPKEYDEDCHRKRHAGCAQRTSIAQASVLGAELRITLGGKGFTLTRQQ